MLRDGDDGEIRSDLEGERMFGSLSEMRIGKQGSIILLWWGILTRRTGRRRRIPTVGIGTQYLWNLQRSVVKYSYHNINTHVFGIVAK